MDSILLFGEPGGKLSPFLRKLGYEVIEETSATKSIAVLTSRIVDLVVVDERFAENPIEVCEYMRTSQETKRVPIVFVCKESSTASVEAQKRLGGEHFELLNPGVSVGLLASKIAMQLRLRKFQGANQLTASASEANAALRDLNERYLRERQEAKEIQLALLPHTIPSFPGLDIAVHYSPLEEVGGDWYFFRELTNHHFSFQLADVTGHGLAAAFICTMTKLALYAAKKNAPDELLGEMNRLMSPHIPAGRNVW